jgi:hypothetical protein
MHEPIVEGLEEYLKNGVSRRPMPAFEAHLAACAECREELVILKEQSQLFEVLRLPRELDVTPGFYARVMDRIDSQRSTSFWSVFLEPAFSRRLALASATFLVVLGTYMATAPAAEEPLATHPSTAETAIGPYSYPAAYSDDPQQERNAVLVNLSSYNETPTGDSVTFSEQ